MPTELGKLHALREVSLSGNELSGERRLSLSVLLLPGLLVRAVLSLCSPVKPPFVCSGDGFIGMLPSALVGVSCTDLCELRFWFSADGWCHFSFLTFLGSLVSLSFSLQNYPDSAPFSI